MKSRFFFLTYTAANVSLVLYGILALLKSDILLEPFFEHVYQFPAEATNTITYLSGLYRLLGYFNIIHGALGLLILHRYWVTRQEWYLKTVIASTILAYLGPIVFDNTVGTIGFFEILEHVLFVMFLISGFVMLKNGDVMTPHSASSSSSEESPAKGMISSWLRSENPTSGLCLNSER